MGAKLEAILIEILNNSEKVIPLGNLHVLARNQGYMGAPSSLQRAADKLVESSRAIVLLPSIYFSGQTGDMKYGKIGAQP